MKPISPPPPLLSIAIATRNRIACAISAIQSILEIPDQRLELVVHDNSDSRELEAYVTEHVNDSRLRYRYSPSRLSMIDNFNEVVGLATGEYLCLIGDDDGVNPEIMEAAAWAKSEDLDSLAIRDTVNYLWPGTGIPSTLFSKVTGGTLSIQPFSGRIIEADLETEIRSLLHNGGLYYLRFNLPKAYHGLTRRRCFESIKEKTGSYFGGTSPDIFSSLAIACVAKRVAVVDYPLTIPGHCRAAENTHHVKNAHLRPLESAPHFRDRGEYHWCELVPRVFIAETFWVESGIAALRAMGREDLAGELNLPKLAAHCIGGYRGIMRPVLGNMYKGLRHTKKSLIAGTMQFVWGVFTGPGVGLAHRAWNRFLLILGVRVRHQINDLENMSKVSNALTRHLRENQRSFSDYVRRRTQSGSCVSQVVPARQYQTGES